MSKFVSLFKLAVTLIFILIFSIYKNHAQSITKQFIDLPSINNSIPAGNDFYLYANGNWVKNNPIPAAKTSWGSFNILREKNTYNINNICKEAASSATKDHIFQLIGNLYSSYMDSMQIEKLGFTPIQAELTQINNIKTKAEIIQQIAILHTKAETPDISDLHIKGMEGLIFAFCIMQDEKNATKYIPYVVQAGTFLPAREYYLKNDSTNIQIRNAYERYIANMFVLIGDNEPLARLKAQHILELETVLAGAQLSKTDLRDPSKIYNKFSVADFSKQTKMDWTAIFSAMKIAKADSLVTNNPSFFNVVDSLFQVLPLDTWKAYTQWGILKYYATHLSSLFANQAFSFEQILSGQKQQLPRWNQACDITDIYLTDALGKLYVQKYFQPAAKKKVLKMVENLQEVFAQHIRQLSWMDETTKQHALTKLHAIGKKIGFPDKWKTYDGLTIDRKDFVGNFTRINMWNYNYMIEKLGTPIDKTEWQMSVPTVNAYYDPVNNEIVFPAGILQFPFFNLQADDAINYGAIGAIIGHEIIHGFDDNGRQYDALGNLKDWWTPQDSKKFAERSQRIVDQYNAYIVNDSLHVNGKLTLGENIADIAGLNISYEAFKRTPHGKSNKKIDGFTADQRFFLSWAQIRRRSVLPQFAAQSLLTDPHSPGNYRCNGAVVNVNAFYDAFDIKKGDNMYKEVTDRELVW